ncbi:hypothetical protein GCM10010404_34750 [Nonomuraea africana]
MKAQAPLKDAADKIQAVLVQLPGGTRDPRGHGFAGIKIEEDRLHIWWKGPLPRTVSTAIEKARSSVRVDVSEAKFSREKLLWEAEKIKKEVYGNPAGEIHGLLVKGDGSGLLAATDATVGANARSEVLKSYISMSSLTVPIEVVQRPRVRSAGRLNDTPSYYGGGRMLNDRGAGCTLGFPVVANDTGYPYIVTASHCGYWNMNVRNGDGSRNIGPFVAERVAEDLALVIPNEGGASSLMWDGGVPGGENTSPEFTKEIKGWSHVIPGEWLCTSGSYSGAVCLWQVENNFPLGYCGTDGWGTYECYGDMFGAWQVEGKRGCRGGDSGGPVFSLSADYSYVIAEGIMSGCNDYPGDGDHLYFQDFATVVSIYNVRPRL